MNHDALSAAPKGMGAVCVAVYKPDRELLRRQLESIRSQSIADWRCHIGIDGLDSEVTELVKQLIGSDERFTVHAYECNRGFYRNFERLIMEVTPDTAWIALSDQDDYWYSDKLERLLEAMSGSTMMVSGQARLVDRYGASLGYSRRKHVSLPALLFDNQITGSLTLFRAEILDKALPFPDQTDAAYHDHWLGAVAAATGGVAILEAVVQDYVQHGANVLGEERRGMILDRVTKLQRLARGRSLEYVALHRWGWRVAMAQRLHPLVARESDSAPLRAIANGGFSVRLIVTALALIVRREVQAARTVALLVGALFWRRAARDRISD